MGLFSRKRTPATPPPSVEKRYPITDERLPGCAGYGTTSLKKNAMPEHRFRFVRPDGKSES